MLWISIFLLSFAATSAELPKFLTKQASDSLRFISMDGRYTYVQRKPGVLSLITSFKNADFLTEEHSSDFLMRGSRFKNRLIIESISNKHSTMSFFKNHKIYVIDYGNSSPREVGRGLAPKLHLRDEWLTFYDVDKNAIELQNLVTQKKLFFGLSKKSNPFFVPEVEMVNDKTLIYTDINAQGSAALVKYDLTSMSSTLVYKSAQSATRLEICQNEGYVGVGEFPYEGVTRKSKISKITLGDIVNFSGLETVYESVEQDTGNMVCRPDSIYFIKTTGQSKDVARLELKSKDVKLKSDLKFVTQIFEMDNRVLIPFRGEFYVLEGSANLGIDTLKGAPSKEELQIDI